MVRGDVASAEKLWRNITKPNNLDIQLGVRLLGVLLARPSLSSAKREALQQEQNALLARSRRTSLKG